MNFKLSFLLTTILAASVAIDLSPTLAQIIPDNTLEKKSSLIENNHKKEIRGGTDRGTNLFHSFKEFNIRVGEQVYFSPDNKIQNIFTRVTGDQASKILGKLGVLGNANLYFINPKGVIFGANSSLDLNGSFLVTTAQEIIFADGSEFDAVNPNQSILTINVPIGLGFTSKPGSIVVEGSGHQLSFNFYSPVSNANPLNTFQVNPGKTLALIGGEIKFLGGVIESSGSSVELAAVANGQVNLDTSKQWNFDYENVKKFNNISLLDKSAIIEKQGKINIYSDRLLVSEGSSLFNQQFTEEPGSININAKHLDILGGKDETITVYPGSPQANELVFQGIKVEKPFVTTIFTPSTIFAENLSNFQGGDVTVSAKKVKISDGGQLTVRAFQGVSGNIFIKTDIFEGLGTSRTLEFPVKNIAIPSNVNAISYLQAPSGNIQISSRELLVTGGSNIATATFGEGKGGSVTLNVEDSLKIIGFSPFSLGGSQITSSAGYKGDAGDVSINTNSLLLKDGGSIITSTYSQGNAGTLSINATNIRVEGQAFKGVYSSQIRSAADITLPNFSVLLNFTDTPTGNAGNIIINSLNLNVNTSGVISVQNTGFGNGGSIIINSDNISLETRAKLNSSTLSGEGGNIKIKTNQMIVSNSEINATAEKTGNGGNISTEATIFIGLDDNKILANAELGNGGNITILSQGLFLSSTTQFLASSQLGLSGQITLKAVEPIDNSLREFSPKLIISDVVVFNTCLGSEFKKQVSFIYNGIGSLPITSNQGIFFSPVLSAPSQSQQDFSLIPNPNISTTQERKNVFLNDFTEDTNTIIEGNRLIKTSDGRIMLVADTPQINYSFCQN